MSKPTANGQESVAARHLDLLLEENLTGRRVPDVAVATMAALARGRSKTGRRLLPAACVLLGFSIVVAIGFAASAGRHQLTQQPPLGAPVTVQTLAEIAQLPDDTDNVRLRLHTAEAVRGLVRLRKLRRLDAAFDDPWMRGPRKGPRPAFFPEAADAIGLLTTLEELDISCHAPVTGLASLATLSRLRRLRIFHALLEPESLSVLKELPRLEDLELQYNLTLDEDAPWIDMRHPDYGLPSFAAAGKLRTLRLASCIADAACIRVIAANPLERLELYALQRSQYVPKQDTSLPASAYVAVGTIQSLRELRFNDSACLELFAELRKLPRLDVLNLSGADGLEGEGVGDAIAALPHVRKLDVSGSFIDNAGLLAITKSAAVVELALGGDVECTGEVLAEVCKMPLLRRLSLPVSPGFTDDDMAVLSNTSLEFVRVLWVQKLTSAGLLHLPTTLREIEVDGHMLEARVFSHLKNAATWSIEFDSRLSIDLIEDLCDSPLGKNIESLKLSGDLGLLSSLAPLAKLPKLRRLDLQRCSGELPAEDVRRLLASETRVVMPLAPWQGEDGAAVETLELAEPAEGDGAKKD